MLFIHRLSHFLFLSQNCLLLSNELIIFMGLKFVFKIIELSKYFISKKDIMKTLSKD